MERQATARFAFGGQFALVVADSFAGEEKLQTDFFGRATGVERGEDLFRGVLVEALAIVLDDQMDVVAGWERVGKFLRAGGSSSWTLARGR